MIQGTTPIHTFNIPFSTDIVKNVRITYAQNGNVLLTKELVDCDVEGRSISCRLTQNDTFAFDHAFPVDIQLRVLTIDDDAFATRLYRVSIEEVQDGEVLE